MHQKRKRRLEEREMTRIGNTGDMREGEEGRERREVKRGM